MTDVENPACPVKEKKYVPLAGAVNFPVDKFKAFPMFNLEIWYGIGTLIVLNALFRWT
jgi:hypothetical protein